MENGRVCSGFMNIKQIKNLFNYKKTKHFLTIAV